MISLSLSRSRGGQAPEYCPKLAKDKMIIVSPYVLLLVDVFVEVLGSTSIRVQYSILVCNLISLLIASIEP